MAAPLWSILAVAFTAFVGAVAMLLFKTGAASVSFRLSSWLLNWQLMVGLALHAVGFVLLVVSLKHGSLSILYPVLATSYVWVALLSVNFLGEAFPALKWAGLALIMGGIALVVR